MAGMSDGSAPSLPADQTPEGDTIVSRAVSGDRDALAALLEREGPAVRERIARAIAPAWRSLLDADDVMQVTYVEAFLRIGDLRGGESAFRAWLGRMAENNLADGIRSLSRAKRPDPRRRVAPSERGVSGLTLLLGATTTTPTRHLAQAEAESAVHRAIERLPPDYREVVRLYDIAGLDGGEVARRMGRSPGAMHMLRQRAHERLRELLGSC
jgi:RNA polymerase sigma-70 factor (ECF subfamily)